VLGFIGVMLPAAGNDAPGAVGFDIAAIVMQAGTDIGQNGLQLAVGLLVFEKASVRRIEDRDQGSILIHGKSPLICNPLRFGGVPRHRPPIGILFHAEALNNTRSKKQIRRSARCWTCLCNIALVQCTRRR
jgi:hypothetical protein